LATPAFAVPFLASAVAWQNIETGNILKGFTSLSVVKTFAELRFRCGLDGSTLVRLLSQLECEGSKRLLALYAVITTL